MLDEAQVAFAGELGGRPFSGEAGACRSGEADAFVFKGELHGDRLAFAGEHGCSVVLAKPHVRPDEAAPCTLEPPPNLYMRALTPGGFLSGDDLAPLA